MESLTVDEAIERDELAEKLATTYMSGFTPSVEDRDRAYALHLSPDRIREAVDACYDPEEDTL